MSYGMKCGVHTGQPAPFFQISVQPGKACRYIYAYTYAVRGRFSELSFGDALPVAHISHAVVPHREG